jgi:hypothetical protein
VIEDFILSLHACNEEDFEIYLELWLYNEIDICNFLRNLEINTNHQIEIISFLKASF